MRKAHRVSSRGCLAPLTLSIALALSTAATGTWAQAAAAAQLQYYDIPAGPLAPALNRFAQESGVALALDANRVDGLRTQGVSGSYRVDDGFARLLQGTGLSIQKSQAGYFLTPATSRAFTAPAVASTASRSAAPALPDTAAIAAAPAVPEPHQLAEIVVSASRSNLRADKSPQTVQVIDRQQIEQQLALSTNSSDVLANLIPSYTPSRGKMNGSGETLRGRTPLILVDGVPQSNPIRPTGREAHTIDFSMVDRVEVVQGANAINGLGATGGTINIITKRPENGAFNQRVELQTSMPASHFDEDRIGYKGAYTVSGRRDKLDYLFSVVAEDQGLWQDARGRAIGADNTQGDLMDSRSYDMLGKLGYWFDDEQRLQLSVNRYRIKSKANYVPVAGNRASGTPTTSAEGTPPGTPPHNDVWTSSIGYTHYNLAGMELSALLFSQQFEGLFGGDRSNTFQDPLIAPAGTLYDQSRAVSSKYGSKITVTKADLLDKRLKLTGGLDLLVDEGKQDLYGTGRTYVPESKYSNHSLFLQGELKLLGPLTVHGGVRKEYADLSIDSYRTLAAYNRVQVQGGTLNFDETLHNAGIVYEPVRGWNLYTSYSEGFGMPDVGRVLRSINTPGQDVDDMRGLSPIVTKSVELGSRLRRGPWEVEASWYRSASDYGARVVRVNDAFMLAREENRIEGIEASLGYRFNAAHQTRLSYSRSKGRYDSNADGTLDARLDGLNISPDRLVGTWSAGWSEKLGSFVQVQHAFSRNFDDSAKRFGGYTLADVGLQYRLPKGSLNVAVSNLFNRDYITYYSQSALVEPLRYFAGRGRVLTLGYAVKF